MATWYEAVSYTHLDVYKRQAVYLSREKDNGTYVYELHQPGGMIEATVEKKGGKTVQCKMGGPVEISEEMTVEITW